VKATVEGDNTAGGTPQQVERASHDVGTLVDVPGPGRRCAPARTAHDRSTSFPARAYPPYGRRQFCADRHTRRKFRTERRDWTTSGPLWSSSYSAAIPSDRLATM